MITSVIFSSASEEFFSEVLSSQWSFTTTNPGAQTVKNPPKIQETQVQSLGWEDPLEKGMVTHSSNPARRIPQTEKPGGLQFMELRRVGHDE